MEIDVLICNKCGAMSLDNHHPNVECMICGESNTKNGYEWYTIYTMVGEKTYD